MRTDICKSIVNSVECNSHFRGHLFFLCVSSEKKLCFSGFHLIITESAIGDFFDSQQFLSRRRFVCVYLNARWRCAKILNCKISCPAGGQWRSSIWLHMMRVYIRFWLWITRNRNFLWNWPVVHAIHFTLLLFSYCFFFFSFESNTKLQHNMNKNWNKNTLCIRLMNMFNLTILCFFCC